MLFQKRLRPSNLFIYFVCLFLFQCLVKSGHTSSAPAEQRRRWPRKTVKSSFVRTWTTNSTRLWALNSKLSSKRGEETKKTLKTNLLAFFFCFHFFFFWNKNISHTHKTRLLGRGARVRDTELLPAVGAGAAAVRHAGRPGLWGAGEEHRVWWRLLCWDPGRQVVSGSWMLKGWMKFLNQISHPFLSFA